MIVTFVNSLVRDDMLAAVLMRELRHAFSEVRKPETLLNSVMHVEVSELRQQSFKV